MKSFFLRLWHADDGVLSFEWTVLTSLLTVGVVSGIATVRDAAIDEMGDLSQAMVSLDQSYYIQPPLVAQVHTIGWGGWGYNGGWGISGAAGSGFADAARYSDCYRGHMRWQEFPRRNTPLGPTVPVDPAPLPEDELSPAL